MEDKQGYAREFISSDQFKITHDAEIALTGATEGEPGVIIIAGTGSIAFGKNARGEVGRAGGWGYIFGDEGGAFDIVRQALRAALAMEEGWGPETSLREILLAQTGLQTANKLLHHWYGHLNRSETAKLALYVARAAGQGDRVAACLIQDAGRNLAQYAVHVFRLLFREGEKALIARVGGVFESVLLTESLQRELQKQVDQRSILPLMPPAAGALVEAMRLAGNMARISAVPPIKT
jgi:N-acetylglucosamine kinase-like BadF-type ATPase